MFRSPSVRGIADAQLRVLLAGDVVLFDCDGRGRRSLTAGTSSGHALPGAPEIGSGRPLKAARMAAALLMRVAMVGRRGAGRTQARKDLYATQQIVFGLFSLYKTSK